MKRLSLVLALGICSLFLCASQTLAGTNASAKILIHLTTPTSKSACTWSGAAPPCGQIVTAGDLYPATYFGYVLVTDADSASGVAGAQFGITYNDSVQVGVDIYEWHNCADLEFSGQNWPAAGSGDLVTWNSGSRCQRSEPGGSGTGVTAVAGYFYCAAYTADTLRVIPRPEDGAAKVAACSGAESIVMDESDPRMPSPLGYAAFSQGAALSGYSPCGYDPDSSSYVPSQLIVKFAPNVVHLPTNQTEAPIDLVTFTPEAVGNALRSVGVTHLSLVVPGFSSTVISAWGDTVQLPENLEAMFILDLADTTVAAAVASIATDTVSVLAAGPNWTRSPQSAPNDPSYPRQWYLNNTGQVISGYTDNDIDADLAWAAYSDGTCCTSVKVGVMDTGIDLTHPDLGTVIQGYCNACSSPQDDDYTTSHGTAVAGIIGARGNNSLGVAGINWGASLVAMKVTFAPDYSDPAVRGKMTTGTMVAGLNWAIANQVPIVNISASSSSPSTYSYDEAAVLKNAQAAGLLVVAPMGNASTYDSSPRQTEYPAAYKNFVCAVGATLWTRARWSDQYATSWCGETPPDPQQSKTGDWIDLGAPGGRYISTTKRVSAGGYYTWSTICPPSSNYAGFRGTSPSAAMVSGVASLLLAMHPSLTGEDLEHIMKVTAHDVYAYGTGWDEDTGYGIVNAYSTLQYIAPPRVVQQGVASSVYVAGTQNRTMRFVDVPGLASGTMYYPVEYEVRASVSFGSYDAVPDVWCKSYRGVGWSNHDPHYNYKEPVGYAEVVPGTLTASGCVLRTYVYHVWDVLHNDKGWYPTTTGNVRMSWTAVGHSSTVGVPEEVVERGRMPLSVWPNPASQATVFKFDLPEKTNVTLTVFDVSGRRVREIVSGAFEAGVNSVGWDLTSESGTRVGNGMYFYQMKTPIGVKKGRLLVVR